MTTHRHPCPMPGCPGAECNGQSLEGCGDGQRTEGCPFDATRCPVMLEAEAAGRDACEGTGMQPSGGYTHQGERLYDGGTTCPRCEGSGGVAER